MVSMNNLRNACCSTWTHLHMTWLIDIIPLITWQKLLFKHRAWRWSWHKFVIVCQPIRRLLQSKFSGYRYTIFANHFKVEHVLFTQWEIFCNWFHLMPVEPIKWKPNFYNLLFYIWDAPHIYTCWYAYSKVVFKIHVNVLVLVYRHTVLVNHWLSYHTKTVLHVIVIYIIWYERCNST